MSINITKTNRFYIIKDQALLAVPLQHLPHLNKQIKIPEKNDTKVIEVDKAIAADNPITGVNSEDIMQCQCAQGYILDHAEAYLRLSSRSIGYGSYYYVATIYNRNDSNNILFTVGIKIGPESTVGADNKSRYKTLHYILRSLNQTVAEGTVEYANGFPTTSTIYTLANDQSHDQLRQYGKLYYSLSLDTTPYLRILMDSTVENGQYKFYVTLQMVTPLQTANGIWLPYTEQTQSYDMYQKGDKQFYKLNETADLTQITAGDTRWYKRWMRTSAFNKNTVVSLVENKELKVNLADLTTSTPFKVSLFNATGGPWQNDLVYNPSLFVTTRPLPGTSAN